MPRHSPPAKDKAAAYEAFERGVGPYSLKKAGFPGSSAYKFYKQWKAERGAPPTVTTVEEPPPIKAANEPSEKQKRPNVTEETAGLILQVLFGIYAGMTHEDLWYLTPAQRAFLQAPFADSLRSIPGPIAQLMNDYAPPVAFFSNLTTVIREKQDLIRRKRERNEVRREEAPPENPAVNEDGTINRVVRSSNGQSTGVSEPEAQTFFG